MIGYDGGTDFYACRNLPVSFPLLDIHATGLAFRVGAAVTAIAAALPSSATRKFSDKKAQKHKIKSCFELPDSLIILGPFVPFCG